MAFIFSEPMTGYTTATDLARNKWTGSPDMTYTPGTGRFSGGSVRSSFDCAFTRPAPPSNDDPLYAGGSIFVHIMIKWDPGLLVSPGAEFLQLKNRTGIDIALTLQRSPSNALVLLDATGTVVGTSANGVLTPNTWHVLVVQAEVGATPGLVNVYVDDLINVKLTTSSANMNLDATQYACDSITFVQSINEAGAAYDLSEIFVYDSWGVLWNTVIGDKRHIPLVPTESIDHSPYPPSFIASGGGDPALMVDDPLSAVSDDDATYTSTVEYYAYDEFVLTDLPPDTTGIIGILSVVTAKKTGAGPAPIFKHRVVPVGLFDEDGNARVIDDLTVDYLDYQAMYEQDHGAGYLAWTPDAVDTLHGGYQVGDIPV